MFDECLRFYEMNHHSHSSIAIVQQTIYRVKKSKQYELVPLLDLGFNGNYFQEFLARCIYLSPLRGSISFHITIPNIQTTKMHRGVKQIRDGLAKGVRRKSQIARQ